jgi:predicted peptidase
MCLWGAIVAVLIFTFVITPEATAQRRGQRATVPPLSEAEVALYEPYTYNEMPYRLMKPIHFDAKKRYPVIVSLHGGDRGSDSRPDNQKQLRAWNKTLADEQLRTAYPSYVLAPRVERMWNAAALQKIKGIIAELPAVNMNRIYVLGHSMGGHGINILLQIDNEYFAAAAPSAGTGKADTGDFIDAELIKDIPIWAFHGDKDNTCPIGPQLTLFDEMKKLNGNMKLTIWAGDGHGVSAKFITGGDNSTLHLSSDRCDPEPDFMQWLFSQRRNRK